MAVIYTTATKTARMEAVVTVLGSGALLKLFTAGDDLLATFTLHTTAGTVDAGVLTLSDANGGVAGVLNTTAIAGGTATKASLQTSAAVNVITGLTVGIGGSDLNMDNNILANTQAVTVNSGTITHA